jgi:hypothetical protein
VSTQITSAATAGSAGRGGGAAPATTAPVLAEPRGVQRRGGQLGPDQLLDLLGIGQLVVRVEREVGVGQAQGKPSSVYTDWTSMPSRSVSSACRASDHGAWTRHCITIQA